MSSQAPKDDIAPRTGPLARPRRRLFPKYVALFVGVVCFALLAEDLVELRFLRQDHTDFGIRLQREQAHAAADKISQFIDDIKRQIEWTNQLPWDAATTDEWRLDAARLLRQVPAITEFIKVDANGREQLRVSRLAPDRIGSAIDYSQDRRFMAARARNIYFGPVNFRRDSEPYMAIAMGAPGNGVSIAEVNLKFIRDVVTRIKAGDQGSAYVIDDQSRLIAHPDLGLVLRGTTLSQLHRPQGAGTDAPSVALDGQIVQDRDGRNFLTASAPIAALNWRVFVELPTDEAFAPLAAATRRQLLILLAALAAATFVGLWLARKMIAPIQALRAGAIRIGGGDFAQRIVVKTGDELEELADQFNHMAAELQQSHAGLQQKVETRTAELSAANNRLASAGEQLRQANVFKNEMLATVAHDLRNPIAAILARVELLAGAIKASPLPPEKVADHVATIGNAGRQLADIVDSLLADAMADAYEITIRRAPVDVPALIGEVTKSSRALADEKGQTLTVAVPGGLTVIGDHDRLREAVDNLVNNAIKFTPLAGHIELTVKHDGERVLIHVADGGPGLTADDKTQLFSRFTRLSARPTAGEISTGLGLSIVKRIVDLHGGTVGGENSVARGGAVFTISLPAAPRADAIENNLPGNAKTADAMRKGIERPDASENATILLVDDEPFLREGLYGLLLSEGLGVASAASGPEALQLVADTGMRPHVIVADYHLHGDMNGVACIEALRVALGRNIPAIMLTGDPRAEVIKQNAAHDITVVAKPVNGADLVRLIRDRREPG